jgi:hypothetical protein
MNPCTHSLGNTFLSLHHVSQLQRQLCRERAANRRNNKTRALQPLSRHYHIFVQLFGELAIIPRDLAYFGNL